MTDRAFLCEKCIGISLKDMGEAKRLDYYKFLCTLADVANSAATFQDGGKDNLFAQLKRIESHQDELTLLLFAAVVEIGARRAAAALLSGVEREAHKASN